MTQLPDPAILEADAIGAFDEPARRAVYDAIALRRDVRHFMRGVDLDDATLGRILTAAHDAPSVGFSQPWRFIVIRDRARRERIRDSFLRVRATEAQRFAPERRAAYLALRLEGLLDAAVNVCVVVDERDPGPVLGTTAQPETMRASAYCAVQNLWLAARVEGIGVGWVSLIELAVLRAELDLPAGVVPVAYLCLGRPVAFRQRPMLEESRWAPRLPLAAVVHQERFVDLASPTSLSERARHEPDRADQPTADESALRIEETAPFPAHRP